MQTSKAVERNDNKEHDQLRLYYTKPKLHQIESVKEKSLILFLTHRYSNAFISCTMHLTSTYIVEVIFITVLNVVFISWSIFLALNLKSD